MLNIPLLLQHVENKLIAKRKHPTEELWIYNYTPEVQYSKLWDEVTLMCRGLILDSNHNIVGLPFKKFFNWQENNGFKPVGQIKVATKMDGSLGILCHFNNKWHWSTRGSFESDQAKMASDLWKDSYFKESRLDENITYLFEIIGPSNKIVNIYNKDELILLAGIDRNTGQNFYPDELYPDLSVVFGSAGVDGPFDYGIAIVAEYLKPKPNFEGYVFIDEEFNRVKVKLDEYVRLHRIVFGTTRLTIWEMLKDGSDFSDLIKHVPDEFYDWVKTQIRILKDQYTEIELLSLNVYNSAISQCQNRKEFAALVMKDNFPHFTVCFALYDQKPYAEIIWRKLRPNLSEPDPT